MSNRHLNELLDLYASILADISHTFPRLVKECERDLARIHEIATCRGMFGFAVDLPKQGKHFDRCLSEGKYSPSGLPFTAGWSGSVIPKFLRGLLLLIFDSNGYLKEDPNVEAILFCRQVYYLAKKVVLPCSDRDTRREIDEFLEVDIQLPEPNGFWDAEIPLSSEATKAFGSGIQGPLKTSVEFRDSLLLWQYLQKTADIVSTTLGRYDPTEWPFKHGPGAIASRGGRCNKYHWYSWPDRLDARFSIADFGYYSWSSFLRSRAISSEEESSRLIAVPKTLDKPRLIAAEPSSHQWCQQNMWAYFRDRVSSTFLSSFVDFRSQERNQQLARLASVTGDLCTVDLSAASDRVTPDVVGYLFRRNPELLASLAACRTRFVRVTRDHLVFTHKLKKFSTMGSACTFPVESLVFLIISLAATLYTRRMPVTVSAIRSLAGSVSVFGDDLIVPKDAWETIAKLLEALCFKINSSKTFTVGNFRESCGVDAFRGVCVSPVYWRRYCNGTPESVASAVDVANHFYQRWMLVTSATVERTVNKYGYRPPVVDVRSGVFGLKSRTGPCLANLRVRYNKFLQRDEVFTMTIKSQVRKTQDLDDSLLHQFFTELPDPTERWVSGHVTSTRTLIKSGWVSATDLYEGRCG